MLPLLPAVAVIVNVSSVKLAVAVFKAFGSVKVQVAAVVPLPAGNPVHVVHETVEPATAVAVRTTDVLKSRSVVVAVVAFG